LFIFAIIAVGQPPWSFAQNEDKLVYLPLIFGKPGKIANGDFEAGRTKWTESSKWSNVLIVQDDDLPTGITPYQGSWTAWLGGDNDEQAYIKQRVTVEPGYRYLTYWYWIDWPFSCQGTTGAVATISLDLIVVYQTDVCQDTDTGGWVKNVLDLEVYQGKTVDLRFQLTTETNSFANFYLDNIDLQTAP
jgi:hypothetical protein